MNLELGDWNLDDLPFEIVSTKKEVTNSVEKTLELRELEN
jgi:hypothetical protein